MSNFENAPPARELLSALGRGLRGRCPRCGRGRLFSGYITPIPECVVCHEHLAPYQTADFAPYLVTFAIGLIFMPLIFVLSLSSFAGSGVIVALLVIALGTAMLMLPRAKGAAVALLWVLDIQTNQ